MPCCILAVQNAQMSTSLKYFISSTLKTVIPFGGIYGLLTYLISGEFHIMSLLFMSVFFGITMSLFHCNLQFEAIENLGINPIENHHLQLPFKKEITTSITEIEVMELIKNDKNLQTFTLEKKDQQILLRSSWSSKSFGEKMSIKFSKKENGATTLKVSSQPKIFFHFFDQGINLQNVLYIEKLINGNISK